MKRKKERGVDLRGWPANRIPGTGRPLSPEELEMIRRQIEGFDHIGAVDGEIRAIVARNWLDLVFKLPPEEE
jgi:hypothetical protein